MLLKNKGMFLLKKAEDSGGEKDIWFQHFRFLNSVNFFAFMEILGRPFWNTGYVVKEGRLLPELTEKRLVETLCSKGTEEWTEVSSLEQLIQKAGLEFLQNSLDYSLTTWFVLPSLINDIYKYSLENIQATAIEEILLKAWLELPSVIDETLFYLRKFADPSVLNLNDNFGYTYNKIGEASEFCILDYGLLRLSLTTDKEEDLTPFTREFLKVCPKIPFHLKEYLYFLKLSLKDKDYSSDFDFFFKLFLKVVDESLLINIKISNESWKLLMYNTPFPLRVINEIQEERNERSRKAALGEKVFGQDQPGGLMFHLHNLSKALAEKDTGKK